MPTQFNTLGQINQAMSGQVRQQTGGFGNWASRTLNNPDVQRLMAGIGSRMDPEGAGGFIGEPTIEMIEAKAAAAAAEKQSQQMEALIKALGDSGGEIQIGEHGEMKIKSHSGKDGKKDRRIGTLDDPTAKTPDEETADPAAGLSAGVDTPDYAEAYQQMFAPMENIMDRLEKMFGGM